MRTPSTTEANCAPTRLLMWTLAHRPKAAEPPAYLLGAQGGKVVLFKSGEDTPVARYEIYLSLLPEADADALRRGIPVATREELNRYLEDFGA